MKSKNKIFSVITISIIIGVGYGYYLFNKPVESIKTKKPHYTLKPIDLLSEFEQDDVAANKMYLDKIIQISGEITKIEEKKNIHIDTGNPLSAIIFELDDKENYPTLKIGDKITIKGLCTGYLMDVVLVGSVVINKN